jgi:ligand-binding sensor domain-containing protein/two-component sensor histidine kinase
LYDKKIQTTIKKLFVILFLFNIAKAQEIKFKHLSVEDGLSRSYVNCMIEDHIGLLWFGTQDGLNRFDGYQFKVFRHDSKDINSISDNNIWSIFEDNTGKIWAGSQDGILNCFNPQTEKFKHYMLDSSNTINGNSITCIYQDKSSKLWIGTYKGGLYRFDVITGSIKHWQYQSENSNSISNNFVTSVFEDLKENLWVGTYNGLCLLDDDSKNQFIRFYHDPLNPNTLSHNTIWTFFQSDNDANHIWVGTFNGLTNIEITNKIFTRIIPDKDNPDPFSRSVSSICEGRINNQEIFWIGTYGGLLKLDLKSKQFVRWIYQSSNSFGISNNLINKVLIDRSGVLWIATQKGINYYSYQKDKFSFHSKRKYENIDLEELRGIDVQAICESTDKTVWIGSSTGLFSLNKFGKSFKAIKNQQFTQQNIWCLEADNSNDLWIGTYGSGLSHLSINTNKIQLWKGNRNNPNDIGNAYVRAVHLDKPGYLWIGLWGVGLNRLDSKTGLMTKWRHDSNDPKSLSYDDVWVITEDRTGRIWIGTYGGGLNLYNPADGGTFYKWTENSKDGESLCNNNILSICESINGKNRNDKKTVLWIGTTNGLNKFSIDNNTKPIDGKIKVDIEYYFSQSEFPFSVINTIEEDNDGHLWISTNNGLIEFDPETGKILNTYTVFDGLQSNEFNPNSACKTSNGEMFIGSIDGINVFYPDSIIQSQYTPPVVLTDFQVFNQPVTVGPESPLKTSINTAKEIILSYNQNVFSFQFASLDYNAPEKNQYAYMMEGFDKDWIYSKSRRFATYTNLDPGEYIFHVKATNSDGIWNEKDTQIAIIITPPFWQTWWFRILMLLIFTGILYWLYRIKVKRILELERLRIKIASDLHDDIGSALTRISLESELLKSNADSEERKNAIQSIGTMSRDIITSMSDVVWSIDSRNDSVEDLINRMKDFAFQIFSPKNVQVFFETNNLNLQKKLKVDIRQNIYLIFKEAVNNAAKYSDSDNIKVILKNDDGKFIMIINDPGTTFSEQKLTGHGLRNMQMRAERIRGKIEFVKEDGFKVVFTRNEL